MVGMAQLTVGKDSRDGHAGPVASVTAPTQTHSLEVSPARGRRGAGERSQKQNHFVLVEPHLSVEETHALTRTRKNTLAGSGSTVLHKNCPEFPSSVVYVQFGV